MLLNGERTAGEKSSFAHAKVCSKPPMTVTCQQTHTQIRMLVGFACVCLAVILHGGSGSVMGVHVKWLSSGLSNYSFVLNIGSITQ